MPKLLLPLVAALAIGGSAAGGAVYLATRGEPVEQVQPSPIVEASPTATAQPSPAPTAGATGTPEAWLTYTDPDFGFSIDYPPEFVSDSTVYGSAPEGMLRFVRFVDQLHAEGYPPGQVSIFVFVKDVNTLQGWLSKHSGDGAEADTWPIYHDVSNVVETVVAGHRGLSFTWVSQGEGAGTLIHELVFFSAGHVLVIGWYASYDPYQETIHSVFDQMIATYRD